MKEYETTLVENCLTSGFLTCFFSELIRVVTIADQFLLLPVVCERTIISRLDGDPNRALYVA